MKDLLVVVLGVILFGLIFWISFTIKRKCNFNLYYKSEVANMLAPLEARIKALEELKKWENKK